MLERGGGQIGVELDVVRLSGMLDVHVERGHDCTKRTRQTLTRRRWECIM